MFSWLYQSKHLSTRQAVVLQWAIVAAVIGLLALAFFLPTEYHARRRYERQPNEPMCEDKAPPVWNFPSHKPDPESYTIVMATFNRPDLLPVVLEHYARMPRVDRMLIVWNNQVYGPPPDCDYKEIVNTEIYFIKQPNNEIQNRYSVHPYVRTQLILNVDDDVLLDEEDILLGWQLSRTYPDRLVGYSARLHVPNGDGTYWYSSFIRERYSMVVGQAFWAPVDAYRWYNNHSDYLAGELRTYVTRMNCCDDIALNMLVTYKTNAAPVWLRTRRTIKMMSRYFKGQSTQTGWRRKRSEAIGDLHKLFNTTKIPLRTTSWVVSHVHEDWNLFDWRWLANSVGLEYVYWLLGL
jgi:hypothetical protein